MGARIAAWGYVALFVDDFATRGLKETCAVDFKQALPDADGALAYLRRLSYVDPDRVAVVGFSQGGDTALKIAAGGAAGFEAAAAFYPPCANLNGAALGIPTLILAGAHDEVTPAADCAELAKRQAPSMAKFVVYPGAAHAFDLPEFATGTRVMGMRLAYDHSAASRSWMELRGFLAARLKR
jgi:dienelactone hydrolase